MTYIINMIYYGNDELKFGPHKLTAFLQSNIKNFLNKKLKCFINENIEIFPSLFNTHK